MDVDRLKKMMRESKSAGELVDLVNASLVAECPNDCKCRIVDVLPRGSVETSECNWSVLIFLGPTKCQALVERVVSSVQEKFNLAR